jgi:hypothetical protein
MWFSVIKMPPNPFGDKWVELSRDGFYSLDVDNKHKYHVSMASYHNSRGNTELRNFHARQRGHAERGREMVFSPDEEGHVRANITMGRGYEIPTPEEYDNMNLEEKRRYHQTNSKRPPILPQTTLHQFHDRMLRRLKREEETWRLPEDAPRDEQ